MPYIERLSAANGKENPVDSGNQQQYRVLYSGHVQGVGFRYTACGIARRFDVTGFVRNLPDGRVELVAEGPKVELTAFLAELGERLEHFVRSTAVDRLPATGQYSAFTIHH
jgi:acylphosphatase